MAAWASATAVVAISAYSANRQAKAQKSAAKAASKPQVHTSVRTPYMAQYLDPIFTQSVIPDALSLYNKNRGGVMGLSPNPNYDSLMKMLQGMSSNQVGFGGSGLGGGVSGTPYYAPRPANPNLIRTNPDGSPMVENGESFYNFRSPQRIVR